MSGEPNIAGFSMSGLIYHCLFSCGPDDLLLDGIRDDEMPQSFSKRREERKSAPTTVSRVIHCQRGKKHREDSSWEVMRRRLHLRERYYVEV
jgi:hypothetical protein